MRSSTIRAAGFVYGDDGPAPDDAAELFHEASKIHRGTALHQARGVRLLASTPELQEASLRSVRRHPQRRLVPLPQPKPLEASLDQLLVARRSARDLAGGSLDASALSALLFAGYGVVEPARRTVPSGGALYPLELYVACLREASPPDPVVPGLYHYDPSRHVLEVVRDGPPGDLLARPFEPSDFALAAAAVVIVSGVFWRSRFKYGLRGYRFALLEAGHVCQNLLLAAAALRHAAVPVGGFYDGPLEALLGIDGVDESVLYAVAVGGASA